MSDDDRETYSFPPGYQPDDEVPTCRNCGCTDFEVTHVGNWEGLKKRRRHRCAHCGIYYRSTQFWEDDDTGIKSAKNPVEK